MRTLNLFSLITLGVVLSMVSVVLAGAPQAPRSPQAPPIIATICPCSDGSPCRCVECFCSTTYKRQYALALERQLPLIVFVGCPAIDVSDTLSWSCNTFPGVQGSGVVVSAPVGGKLLWLTTLSANASATEIRAACRERSVKDGPSGGSPVFGGSTAAPFSYSIPFPSLRSSSNCGPGG